MDRQPQTNLLRKVAVPIILLVVIYIAGTIGYMIIEKWSFLEALFMATITVTTVGYTLVRDLSSFGMIYTIVFIIVSTGTAAYLVISIADFIVQTFLLGSFQGRRVKKMISKLKNHYIICGFGRVGREIAKTLNKENIRFVIIDKDEEAIAECDKNGWLYIKGDAATDEILIEAGIERAKGMLAAVGDDSENIYSVLSAKALNPNIYIVARASKKDAIGKLKKAGAERVITPEIIGARRMASLVLQPAVCDFLDGITRDKTIQLELAEIEIYPKSKIDNITIRDAGEKYSFGALIISVVDAGDKLSIIKASGDTVLKEGQKLIAIGTKDQIQELNNLAI
jgi:voltage-gated potassium channel